MSGPLPRWIPKVHTPVTSPRNIGLPPIGTRSAFPHYSAQRLQCRPLFRGCSHSLMFRPLALLATLAAPTILPYRLYSSSDFYIRPYHSLLPHCAPDMLTVRTGQLTVGNFHPIKPTALSAGPPMSRAGTLPSYRCWGGERAL